MIAHVIPFRKMPRNVDFFDYLIPASMIKILKVGHLVEVPFKQTTLLGLVYAIDDNSRFSKLKTVQALKLTTPYLLDYQLKLAQWFSYYYHFSLASIIKMMAPPLPKTIREYHQPMQNLGSKTGTIPTNIIELSRALIDDHKKNFYLTPADPLKKMQLLVCLAEEIVRSGQQILILVPHHAMVQTVLDFLPAKLGDSVVAITSKVQKSKNHFYKITNQIRQNKKKIIIGTRSAVFIGIPNLKIIFIDLAHHEDYKSWDQTPRYHAVTVAQKIQALTGCQLVLSSSCPRASQLYEAQKNNYGFIRFDSDSTKTKLEIIDMLDQARNKFTYLSEPLINSITRTLDQQKKILLIVNKLGYASHLICSDCDHVYQCDKCDFPLTLSHQQLRCFNCQTAEVAPLQCIKCGGNNLLPLGVGLEQIQEQIQQLFPRNRVSVDLNLEADIYLSTAQIYQTDWWAGIGLLGLVYIDSLMYFPDYATNEKILQLYYYLMDQYHLFNRTEKKIIVQTFFPDNQAIQSLKKGYQKYYQAEIESRKKFKYPPFCSLLKIYIEHPDQKICSAEAGRLYQRLQLENKKFGLEITAPFFYYRQVIRGRYRCQIIVKLPKNKPKIKYIEDKVMFEVPEYWRIDKDPISVL